MSLPIKRSLLAVALIFTTLFLSFRGQDSLRGYGESDFRAYWGASFLLSKGERFNDNDLLYDLQQRLTTGQRPNIEATLADPNTEKLALMTWNPPWILVLLLPLTFYSFYDASYFWLFANIFFFIWSIEAIWSIWPENHKVLGRKLWLYASVLLFSPLWTALAIGQIAPLLLFGLVGSIYFSDKRPFIAGICLTLLTAKPHLVLITLPILLLDAYLKKNWHLILGFGCSLILLTSIGLSLRPTLFLDYITDTGSPTQTILSQLPAPFLPFFFANWLQWLPLRFIGVAFVPTSFFYWFRKGEKFTSKYRAIQITVVAQLLSLLIAPYGFAFDQILILPTMWVILLSIMPFSTASWQQTFVILCLLIAFMSMIIFPLIGIKTFKALTWFIPIIGLLYIVIQPFKILENTSLLKTIHTR